jgi:hypothetical protein
MCGKSKPMTEDLGVLLEHIQENVARLGGDGTVRLAGAFARMSDADGVPRLDALAQSDISELWALVRDIADENGLVWEAVQGEPDDEDDDEGSR